MKKSLLITALLLALGFCGFISAQTNPGTANLKHRWTFDNGSNVDEIGGVAGVIVGNGVLANNGFVSTNAHMRFPASQIAINTYPELTVELWCTSVAGANGGWTMLCNFGETNAAGQGVNCTFLSIARGDNVSMATLEAPNWNGCTGPEYDDGKLHHFAYTVTATAITLFIDGNQVSTANLTGTNSLANISTSLAYLGRGGWTADPNWIGTFHKFSLYNKALSPSEILFLYQAGAEANAVITATKSNIALDGSYSADAFNVTGANLSAPINITVPAGITAVPASLPANATGAEVYVVWDGTTAVNGNITLASGSTQVNIPVKTANDSGCYTPMFTDVLNLVQDPGLNSLSFFGGWGTRELRNIVTDPANVYCGASSMAVGNGTSAGSGSLNVDVTGRLVPNTMYRVKAMVKTVDGSFQMGVLGWSQGEGDINHVIDTQGEWKPLEFSFTTGAILRPDVHVLFWNNWQCTGTLSYIDNWEIYEAPDAQLNVSVSSEAFDPEYKEFSFAVTGANLSEPITIALPAGLSSDVNTVPADAQAAPVKITWDGATAVNGEIVLTSARLSKRIAVKSTSVSNNSCFVPLYTTKTNMVGDPFVNSLSNFGGWGSRGIISIATARDSVFCGSHSGRVSRAGSLDVMLTGRLKKNTAYLARAMVMTVGGHFQLGVWGMNALIPGDVQDSLDTQGTWMPISVEFATSDSLAAVHGMFFNNYQRSGRVGYIDNWELYEMGGTSLNNLMGGNSRAYFSGNRLMVEMNADTQLDVHIAVYNMQGMLLASEMVDAMPGKNSISIDGVLPAGVYVMKINAGSRQMLHKLVK